MLYIVNTNQVANSGNFGMIPIRGGLRYIIFDDVMGICTKVVRGNSILSFLKRDLERGKPFRFVNFNGDINNPYYNSIYIEDLIATSRDRDCVNISFDEKSFQIAWNYSNINLGILSVGNGTKHYLKIQNWYFEFKFYSNNVSGRLILSDIVLNYDADKLDSYVLGMMGKRPYSISLLLYFCNVVFIDSNTIHISPKIVKGHCYLKLQGNILCQCHEDYELFLNLSDGVLKLVKKDGKIKETKGISEDLIVKELVFNH